MCVRYIKEVAELTPRGLKNSFWDHWAESGRPEIARIVLASDGLLAIIAFFVSSCWAPWKRRLKRQHNLKADNEGKTEITTSV